MDLLQPIYAALSAGHYALVAAMVVVVITGLLRKFGGPTSWVHTAAGGTALALVTATAASMAVTLGAPNAVFTFGVLWVSLGLGVMAAGGYAAVKNLLIDPILRQVALKAPAWAQPYFKFVFFIFDSKAAIPEVK